MRCSAESEEMECLPLHGFLGCAAAFFLKIFVFSGAFAKYLFDFLRFQKTIGGRNAAELLFFIVFRRQRFSHACRIRIIQLLQLFPIGLYGLAVVFVAERSVRKIGSDFRPHRLPVGEKCRTRKTAFPTFCEQPCACCEATVSRGVFNHSRGCSFCNIKSAALPPTDIYINLLHQKRLNLFAFQCRLDSGGNHFNLCNERGWFL